MPRRKGKDADTGGHGTQREQNTDDAATRPSDPEKRNNQKRGVTARVDSRRERVIHRGERYRT
jgi:hypothetical protein